MNPGPTELDPCPIAMGLTSPYDDVDWETVEHHLAQFHVHEPRNALTNETSVHEPDVDWDTIPPHVSKNDLSPASSPRTLIEKYRNAGYTVLALTEHEYFVDGMEYPNDAFREGLRGISWPWSRWDVTPEDLGIVGLQGAELGGRVPDVADLHHLISLANDYSHGRFDPMTDVLAAIDDRDGLAFLAHPAKYADPDDWHRYRDLFGDHSTDTLCGVEIVNASDRYPGRALWDGLLTAFGADRPIWAIGGDDYHARARPVGEKRFNRARIVLLLAEHTNAAVVSALRTGRSYVQYNAESAAPFIEAIEVAGDAISIEAPTARGITWIADGREVGSGARIGLDRLDDAQYVRASVAGDGDAVSFTQPMYFS